MTIELSKHGYERSKKRTTAKGKNAIERAEKAYWVGKDIQEYPKKIQRYLQHVLEGSSGDELKVLGNDIYIFGNKTLITTFPLNPKLINSKKRRCKIDDYEEDY